MNKYLIIGVDPGKGNSGVAIVNQDGLQWVGCGPVSTPEALSKLAYAATDEVYRIVSGLEIREYEIYIVSEDQHISPGKGATGLTTALARGLLVGSLTTEIATDGISWRHYRPSEWRKILLGPGAAMSSEEGKQAVFDWVLAHELQADRWLPGRRRKLLYDETDAIGIARAFERELKEGNHEG